MAVSSRSIRGTELQMHNNKWKDKENSSPERTKVWSETHNHKLKNKEQQQRKVPVVYYLTRNGQLEHPHFMEVPLSSPDGLYLKDVIDRLNFLRGKGMASLYSWSAKRSYRNGFVWHDLAEHDFIYPAHAQEYVLKGSELITDGENEEASFSGEMKSGEFPAAARRRNQSWCSADFHVYKAETRVTGDSFSDAATQTDDRRRRRRSIGEENSRSQGQSTELTRGEISPPPPSDSSPETLETLMKVDGRVIGRSEPKVKEEDGDDRTAKIEGKNSGRASTVLMQLISCGAMSFKDCGPGPGGPEDDGLGLVTQYKSRLPRGWGSADVAKVEDKEYFSGSLIETKKELGDEEYTAVALKRSSSFNAAADRSIKLEIRDKEVEGVRAKCIPRKPKNQSSKKEVGGDMSCSSSASITSSSSNQHGGSKRIVVQPQL